MMTTYIPEWAREGNPTANMSYAEMIAYYKAHSLAGDAMFALRPGTQTPAFILAGWADILTALDKRNGKATPALKAEGKRLRTLTREWLAAQPRAVAFEARESEAA